jgi:hypothetical protein
VVDHEGYGAAWATSVRACLGHSGASTRDTADLRRSLRVSAACSVRCSCVRAAVGLAAVRVPWRGRGHGRERARGFWHPPRKTPQRQENTWGQTTGITEQSMECSICACCYYFISMRTVLTENHASEVLVGLGARKTATQRERGDAAGPSGGSLTAPSLPHWCARTCGLAVR